MYHPNPVPDDGWVVGTRSDYAKTDCQRIE